MRSRSSRSGIGAVFLLALASCGGGSSGQGGLRQACYPNATCNPALTCVSDVCVDLSGGGGAGGGTAGKGGAGAGGVGNTGGAATGTGGVGNIGGAAAGAGGVGNTGGATAGTGGSTACASPTRYTQTTISGGVGQTTTGISPYEEDVQGTLVPGATPDILDIELYSNMTDFPADITTGTFHLTVDDGEYLTCNICLLIYAKSAIASTGEIQPQATYLASSGTLTLTSVASKTTGTGTIAGSLSNATFQQVTIDPGTYISTPVGTCTTSLANLTFSVTSTNAQ